MTTESVPRWRRLEPDERKEQIFSCAAIHFGKRPYPEVSTSDIAADAGVARGLINHYFGTKRNLYLAVVKRALTIPHAAVRTLPDGSLEAKTQAAVDWFLDQVTQQERTWLDATTLTGIGQDPEVEHILAEADRDAADRVLEAVGITSDDKRWDELNALVRAYGGMVKVAGREWLAKASLTRNQVHALLSKTLLALIRDVFPGIQSHQHR